MAFRPGSERALARAALLTATVVWGASFAINQRALADLPVFHLLSCRFALASLLLLPLLGRRAGAKPPPWPASPAPPGAARKGRPDPGRRLLHDGLVLGVFLFAGFALQTLGLL
jgi:drug/metabolite transporter (DMT)-like permease